MKNYKNDIIQFLVWMRNGIAFCTCWLLILLLLYNHHSGIKSIPTDFLIHMMVFITGGVFLFSFFFTRLFLRKWRFVTRLTCFMLLISIYECIAFYSLGLFVENGTFAQWLGFIGIVLLLYVICLAIYQSYSKKQGELYTQALKNYQIKRSSEYGK